MKKKDSYILWFNEIGKEDIALVGGKGANLGEMTSFKIPVPNGFCVTSKAYFDFLEINRLRPKMKQILKMVDTDNPQTLNEASQKIKKIIVQGKIPKDIAREIMDSYLKLGGLIKQALVAIRSSATAEDLPTASFAGQQRTFLNIKGESNVVESVRECWASLFEARAIFYRQEKGFEHFKVGLSAIVQEMIPSEVSGVMFTIDPVTNQKNRILIEAIWGLGDMIVQGQVTPDQYLLDKNSLEILNKRIEKQTVQLKKIGNLNKESAVPKNLQLKRKLNDKQIVELAKLGNKIHRHYFFPQDIEWILYKNKLLIVQTRPVTTLVKSSKFKVQSLKKSTRKIFLTGQPASPGMGSGPVCLIKSSKEINKVKNGDILVTEMTTPDFVPVMKKVAAIITDKGGQTSHAAIVSRELGIPCVVGTKKATLILKNEQIITVNGSRGEIYRGGMVGDTKYTIHETKKESVSPITSHVSQIKTAAKIYVNLAEAELAKSVSLKNVDGVGLLRAEFMMAQIGVHPKKIIRDRKQKMFIDKLAENIKTFCQAFNPRPVIYRTTDFKTNEYRHLVGGPAFEPEEENPFLGFRGAFRYLSNPECFEMELAAIKKVRETFSNLWLMIPFCRTPRELREVKKIVVSQGLVRSSTFKFWFMVEIPANVIMLEDFIKIGVDGVSIGSNDLTMLLLGVDRDNSELAATFNELDPTVLWALERTIKTCQKNKITCSICGQAPSVYPDFVEKLVKWGITSISVNPDAIERTRELVYHTERCRK